ncbi:MAG TPA: segregation/condensation protein A, partial [Glaciihabitans sp.]|nr:segregation/condensation protein A [Glaciihabitans sp.]
IAGSDEKGVIIARFLAVLVLYRHGSLTFDQDEPLGELTVTWTAENWNDSSLAALGADYDN